jgi:uncharacterized protein (DUF305 family)
MRELFLAVTAGLLVLPAVAQQMDHSSNAHDHTSMTSTVVETSAATLAYAEINARMHEEMDIEFTGDPDLDFILGMIPHHAAAVEMAKVVLEHGKDPKVQEFARQIIRTQDSEIEWMRLWLEAQSAAQQ